MKSTKKLTWESFCKFLDKNGRMLCNLWERWQDEKEYEDIADYGKVISKELGVDVSMDNRPFGFHVICSKGLAKATVTCRGNKLAVNARLYPNTLPF